MKILIGTAFALALSAMVCPILIRLFNNIQAVLDKLAVVQ